MNRDDIIRMALEAGMIVYEGDQDRVLFDDSIVECLKRFVTKAVQQEREACAKLADEQLMNTSALMSMPPKSSAAWNIAAAIRARGQ